MSDHRWANEKLHAEGKRHIWKLWGMILCRPCAAEKGTKA